MPQSDGSDGAREELWQTIIASTASGIAARVVCHPLDTCKSRLQASSKAATTTPYRGLLHVARATWAGEGLAGFYRGIGATLVGSAPGTCLYLTSYEEFKRGFLSRFSTHPVLCHLLAGFAAEAFSCVVWVPIDVVKERLQIQHSYHGANHYAGSWDALRTVMRYEGLRGIYKGYGSTLLSFGPYSALFFAFYEAFKAPLRRQGELVFLCDLAAGATAAGAAGLLTSPLDLVKIRLQIQRRRFAAGQVAADYNYGYSGLVGALRTVVRTEGWRSLFKGADSRILHSAMMSACTLASYEWAKDRLRTL
eukprot:GGOE01061410.1.p1 GENE.GGOE01061410.1~~GGOE01061410.1.p1  ORF type:complete len:307 (+),score=68.75 GGOE01061410.1:83-1003(+)